MDSAGTCKECGAGIPAGSPKGSCPKCLFKLGLSTKTEAGGGKGPFEPPSLEDLQPLFPRYRFERLLGRGGMGAVYLARQEDLDRLVAIKVLPATIAEDPAFKKRFLREARSLAKLNHPHIVTIFDIGEADPYVYFVMEYIEGRDLAEICGEGSPAEAIRIAVQLCEGLAFAHEAGVVHRDIKPANILLDAKARPRIVDFGLAKLAQPDREDTALTMVNQRMGTPMYMAPEQRDPPFEVDHRSDIYSLGVVLYQLLTGSLPTGRVDPPSSDPGLNDIVFRAMHQDPDQRYASATELKADLEGIDLSADLSTNKPSKGPSQMTVLFSGISGYSLLTESLSDREASAVVEALVDTQTQIIESEGQGRVRQITHDAIMALFETPSAAMKCALALQHRVQARGATSVRIGIHMGEVLIDHGERVDIVGRHINRARHVMEMAAAGQILASKAVVDAGRDFVDTIPGEDLGIVYHGEFYREDVGAIELCEVTDLRIHQPQSPAIDLPDREEQKVKGRLALSGYTDLERIGEGGCGVAYKAREEKTGRAVLLKVLNPGAIRERNRQGRFEQAVKRLEGDGIVVPDPRHLDHQPPFLVSDFTEGTPVDVALNRAPTKTIAETFRAICAGLETAHQAGLVHARLKPGNLLLDRDGRPRLLDFGLGDLTSSTSRAGTTTTASLDAAGFLAPEQIRGDEADNRTDIYALGVILYRILAGTNPFHGDSIHALLDAHLYDDPALPCRANNTVDDGLQRICLKAMEKEREVRYATVGEMAEDLQRVIAGERVKTRPSLYDNLLYNRAARHVAQAEEWAEQGLIGTEDRFQITAAYDRLLKRGIAAVVEFQRLRPGLVANYAGGWLIVVASILWTTLYWHDLSTWQRLLIGSTPVVFSGIVAWAAGRVQHYRLVFMMLVVLVLATPLICFVWTYEFDFFAHPSQAAHDNAVELVPWNEAEDQPIANRQLAIILFLSLVVSLFVTRFTETATHAAQTAMLSLLFYGAVMLCFGLKHMIEHEAITKACLCFIPLVVLAIFVARAYSRQPGRSHLAIPWVYLASGLLIAANFLMPKHLLPEWFGLEEASLNFLLMSLFGLGAMLAGFSLRNLFGYRGGVGTRALILTGATAFWGALIYAANEWPEDWFTLSVFSAEVPPSAMALPLVAALVVVAACWRQIFVLMMLGLIQFAISVFWLGMNYFDTAQSWPATLLMIGFVVFISALAVEWRFFRGDSADMRRREDRA